MKATYVQDSDYLLSIYDFNYSPSNFIKLIDNYSLQCDKFAVCLLDISNFKFYNYMFGYEYGNKVLTAVLNKVRQCINNNGCIYRFTGDVFLIILDKINCKKDVIATIQKIMDIFNNPLEVTEGKEKLRLLIKAGISIYPDDSNIVQNVLQYAGIALNYVKNNCINQYVFFDIEMYENILKKSEIDRDLLDTEYNNKFTLYYQPEIDINTMQIYGMEALLRWRHPKYGIVGPSYFIDAIEKNGMINKVGRFVFFEACKEIKKWHDLGYDNLSISINVSAKQLEDSSFSTFVYDVLKKIEIDPKYINIEITERVLVNPTNNILNMLMAFRSKGIKIFIDDFGTKYSSLNYLYCLPIDGIKIDKSFIDDIHNSDKKFIITKNIIRLAQELEIEVVAEGIEKKEQLECLKNINCNKIQGFFFGKLIQMNLLTI